jgi:hypothetical protein
MSAEPKDPLAFDFGIGFESSAERVRDEHVERESYARRELPFGVAFLDDSLRSILPHDLILLGAATGAGKTELAERQNWEGLRGMNYPDWYRGRCNAITRLVDADAERIIREKRKTLFTYYRGSRFDHAEIKRLFLAIQSQADLIILDHLHYVDIEDENENRGFKQTIKMIRDVALGIGRPVILIAHLRKRDQRLKTLVPHIDDFHGSSDIAKVVTHAVMLAPAYGQPASKGKAPTYMYIPKDRHGGYSGLIALCEFDRRARTYGPHYTLGRAQTDKFQALGTEEVPQWAKRHAPISVPMGGAS